MSVHGVVFVVVLNNLKRRGSVNVIRGNIVDTLFNSIFECH